VWGEKLKRGDRIMPLVAAKCTQCGASLEVDAAQDAAICKHCGTPFIVEKAISNYNTVNVYGGNSLESLMKRGLLALEYSNYSEANDCFNRVLDIDPEHAPVYVGMLCAELRVKNELYLANQPVFLSEKQNFQKALRFANADLRTRLESYNESASGIKNERDKQQREQEIEQIRKEKEQKRKEKEQKHALIRKEKRKQVIKKFCYVATIGVLVYLMYYIFSVDYFTYISEEYEEASGLFFMFLPLLITSAVMIVLNIVGRFHEEDYEKPIYIVMIIIHAILMAIWVGNSAENVGMRIFSYTVGTIFNGICSFIAMLPCWLVLKIIRKIMRY
jgi:tetratricopeptide (TPR) repeat protein